MANIKEATIAEIEEARLKGVESVENAKAYYLSLDEKDPMKPMVFSQVQLMSGMDELLTEVIRLRKEIES